MRNPGQAPQEGDPGAEKAPDTSSGSLTLNASDSSNDEKSLVEMTRKPLEQVELQQIDLQQSGEIDPTVRESAKKYVESEEALSTWQTACLWKWSICWGVIMSFSIVMEGYDLALMPNYFSLNSFKRKFGDNGPIPSLQQSLTLLGSQVGQIFGVAFAPWLVDKTGYRLVVFCGLLLAAAFLLITFFAEKLVMIQVAELLLGLPWGVFQGTAVPYITDLVPQKLRQFMATYVNMCWVFGQLLSSGMIKVSMVIHDDTWAFRTPIAVQWIWPMFLTVAIVMAPESPWWLVRHGMISKAEQTVSRLTGDRGFDADGAVSNMRVTNDQEMSDKDSVSYGEVFRGANLRRTEIVMAANLTQQWCGSHLMFYSAKVFQMGGMPESMSFTFNLVMYGLAATGVLGSWVGMKNFGRRTIWLAALSTLLVLLVAIGTLGFYDEENKDIAFAIGSLLLCFSLVYNLSIGPVCYTLVSEVPSSRLKAKTAGLSRASYNGAGIFNLFIGPKMLESTESGDGLGLGPKTALFWAGMCTVCLTWAFFRLPETKDRSHAELEVLFSKKIPARTFADMQVDQFERTLKDKEGNVIE